MIQKNSSRFLWYVVILGFVLIAVLIVQVLWTEPVNPELPGPARKGPLQAPPEVISRIDQQPLDRVSGEPETVPVEAALPLSKLYQGIHGRALDGKTGDPVSRFTLWYCEKKDGDILNNMGPGNTKAFRRHDGILRIMNLDEGEYAIAIKAQGYMTFIERGLKVPQEKPILDFSLARGTHIEGRVVDAKGQPVTGMQVLMALELENPEDSAPARRSAETDSRGGFLFGGLPPGKYSLFLKSFQHPLDQVTEIYLGHGGAHFQQLTLPPLATVTFTITDTSGNTLPNSVIKLYEKEGKAAYSLKTDMYGTASCRYVPAGDYSLRIYKNTYDYHLEESFKILPGSDTIRVTRALTRGN